MEVNSHNNTFYSAPGSEMSKYRAMAHTETNHHDIFHSHTHQMTSKETIKLSSPLKMSISNNSIHSIKGNSSSNASMPSLEKNIWIMTPLSKCTERPCFLATNHFFAQEKIYSELKMKIEQVLKGMQDYDVSYFDTECMWKCKYLHGSDFRENHVTCFWDSIANDHVVEVKKYRGDAFFPSLAQFFRDLKSAIVKEDSASGAREVPVASSSSGSRLRGGALPMPSLRRAQTAPPTSSTMSSPSSSACCMVTEDMFLLGIQPLFNMAQDNFLEPRLEAAKALCDLARKEKKFLELPTCREQCVHAINALLRDDFEDVKQFAVMAFASFCEIPSYQESFSKISSLSIIVSLVRNCSPEAPSFECAQIRRKAAEALALIGQSYPLAVKECLEQNGFRGDQDWLRHVESLMDERLRNHAMNMSTCYTLINDY